MSIQSSNSTWHGILSLLLILPAFATGQSDIRAIPPSAQVIAIDSMESPEDTAIKESHYFSFNLGTYNILRSESIQGLFEGAFYPSWKLWLFHLYAGFFVSTNTCSYIYAGITIPIPFSKRYFFRISFAPGFFTAQDEEADLGFPLEFRSSIKFGVQFKKKSRLGLEFSHISNAGFGHSNPGTETLVITYEMPFK
ncbi:MAG: acyloxyacyl hydrolase [Bacteroidia bacterium]|nr:acyloxyacyl hydrolase [Bacteroidia bacterium]